MIIEDYQFTVINEKKILQETQERAAEVYLEAEKDWRRANSQLVKEVDSGNL